MKDDQLRILANSLGLTQSQFLDVIFQKNISKPSYKSFFENPQGSVYNSHFAEYATAFILSFSLLLLILASICDIMSSVVYNIIHKEGV